MTLQAFWTKLGGRTQNIITGRIHDLISLGFRVVVKHATVTLLPPKLLHEEHGQDLPGILTVESTHWKA